MLKPSDYKPHHMGDGKRFHVRPCADKFQVYGAGLYHICDCDRHEAAEMIADALEQVADSPSQTRLIRAFIAGAEWRHVDGGYTTLLSQRVAATHEARRRYGKATEANDATPTPTPAPDAANDNSPRR